ncbi:MAG: bifunctional nuclease family protein [Muribaculaceae bacterium]|nr:bifunctional nuclease family protein [Muribaculaceae bacterium]
MSDNKIEMDVMGISYSQIKQEAHALVLKQHEGDLSMVVVIGVPEANSIFATLNHVITPRPMTHDLMISTFHAFGISLDEVFIYSFDEGVYKSRIKLSSNQHSVELEARTSDAVALALRTNTPVFTNQAVLDKAGFVLSDDKKSVVTQKPKRSLADLSIEELQQKLSKAVEVEKYELAASIQKTIKEKLSNETQKSTEGSVPSQELPEKK